MTVYQLLTEAGISPDKRMLHDLGGMVSAFAKSKGIKPVKVEQVEPTGTYLVNNYEEGFTFIMKQICQNYFEAINIESEKEVNN